MRKFVLFGASGDLAIKKIYPGIYSNYKDGLDCEYIGYGRTELPDISFRDIVRESIGQDDTKFLKKFSYINGSYDKNGLGNLKDVLKSSEDTIYYLSLPNQLDIVKNLINGLKENNLITSSSLFVIEKPLGNNYTSAKELIDLLEKNIGKEKIFLIDHYLSKELVRNLISVRFSNPIFEHLWNNKYIEKIDIEISEDIGIGKRGQYYDNSGAIRDMIQSHGLQLLTLVTMDQPGAFNTENFHVEKEKVLKNVRVLNDNLEENIKVGQYEGYRGEEFVNENSLTETYASINLEVNTERWRGMPINISTGKELKEKKTEIRIYFKSLKNCMWKDFCEVVTNNVLVLNIYPRNEIVLSINGGFNPKDLPEKKNLTLSFEKENFVKFPYANALKDVYMGEKVYTPSTKEVLYSWKVIDRIEEWLESVRKDVLKIY
jgi:glucose-6-phosphate 1-dehydrogenase